MSLHSEAANLRLFAEAIVKTSLLTGLGIAWAVIVLIRWYEKRRTAPRRAVVIPIFTHRAAIVPARKRAQG